MALRELAARASRPVRALAGPRARSAGVLVVALLGTAIYAAVLDHAYAVRDWLFWRVALLWLYGAFFSGSCLCFGHLVLSRALRVVPAEPDTADAERRPALEVVVLSVATGVALFVSVFFAAGFAGLYRRWFALLVPAAMLAAGAPGFVRFARAEVRAWRDRPPEPRSPLATLVVAAALAFGVYSLILVYLEALTPDAICFDAAWCHITAGQDYAREGRVVPFIADYTKNHPHLASIIHTWGFLLPVEGEYQHWMLALHQEFFLFLWSLAGVAAVTGWLLGGKRPRGAWVAFFLFPAIYVAVSNVNGSADHYAAFFVPPLFLASVRWIERFRVADGVLFGILAGAAVNAKYQSGYFLVACAVVVVGGAVRALWRARGEGGFAGVKKKLGPLALTALAAAAACFLVVAPYFARNWLFFKDPFYPFAQEVFRGATPSHDGAAFLVEWLHKEYRYRQHGTTLENLKASLALFFTFPFSSPFMPKNYPFFGAVFTLSLPMVPFLRQRARIGVGLAVAFVAVFLWAYTFRVDRNLQVVFPILAAVTAAVLARAWELGWAARAGVSALVILQVIWGGDAPFYDGGGRLQSAIALLRAGYDGRLKERFDYRSQYTAVRDALPPNARVLFHYERPSLGIDREILTDMPGGQAYILYDKLHGPHDLWQEYRDRGVTHVLVQLGGRAGHTRIGDVLFYDFVTRYCSDKKKIWGWDLCTVPADPPPPDHRYRVLALGMPGYRDGLYDVEQLAVNERLPPQFRRYPGPRTPADPGKIAELARDADAVLLGARSGNLASALGDGFSPAVSFARDFSLYLRH